MVLVVPNLMSIALWSPPLDGIGNSVRGLQFSRELVERFNFHRFDNLRHSEKKARFSVSVANKDEFSKENFPCTYAVGPPPYSLREEGPLRHHPALLGKRGGRHGAQEVILIFKQKESCSCAGKIVCLFFIGGKNKLVGLEFFL